MRTILAISLAVCVSLIASSVFASGLRSRAELSGAQETPTVATDGTGEVEVEFDDAFTKVNVRLTVSNTVGAVVPRSIGHPLAHEIPHLLGYFGVGIRIGDRDFAGRRGRLGLGRLLRLLGSRGARNDNQQEDPDNDILHRDYLHR